MSFYNHCRRELKDLLKDAGFESYRADQIFKMIYQKSLSEQYLPKSLLKHLNDNFSFEPVGKICKESVSQVDNTKMLLIELDSPKYKVESKLLIHLSFVITIFSRVNL